MSTSRESHELPTFRRAVGAPRMEPRCAIDAASPAASTRAQPPKKAAAGKRRSDAAAPLPACSMSSRAPPPQMNAPTEAAVRNVKMRSGHS